MRSYRPTEKRFIHSSERLTLNKPDFYDGFEFLDSLTNRRIAVRDIRKIAQSKKVQKKDESIKRASKLGKASKQEISELDDCIEFLKNTNHFKMSALRKKLFIQYPRNEKQNFSQSEQKIKKKHLIRNIVSSQIDKKNREQLQSYLGEKDHKLDNELVKISRNNHFDINKRNIVKIVSNIQKKQPHSSKRMLEKIGKQNTNQPFDDFMNSFQSNINAQLKQKIKANCEFLVQATNTVRKPQKICTIKAKQLWKQLQFQKQQDYKCLQFSSLTYNLTPSNRHHRGKQLTKDELQLINLIRQKQCLDVEIFLKKKGQHLMFTKDESGNNVLHISVESNQTQSFQYLTGRLGISKLLEPNNNGQSPIALAKRLGYLSMLKYISPSLL